MKPPRSTASPRPATRRGIALIITLLMLSVVTITAVAFLAVSRRERAATATSADQIDARYVAQAGLNHAQGRLTSRMAASTNRVAYGGYFVSTNFANPFFAPQFYQPGSPLSFLRNSDYRVLTNVSYYKDTNYTLFNLSSSADRDEYARALANLYYDPRPPVFVATNRNPQFPPDFRFYLDLNRNGQFDTNGVQWQHDRNGLTNGLQQEWFWGDPEWIGLLQNPDFPHSGTNHFIGRFAYVVVPAARTLDFNFLGNDAKRLNQSQGLPGNTNQLLNSGFMRNQGVGTWEVNAAGFFAALNTNVWLRNANDYLYQTNVASGSTGIAFSDAERLRRFRQGSTNQLSAANFYQLDSGNPDVTRLRNIFQNNLVDDDSDGPLVMTVADVRRRPPDNDNLDRAWPGADLTNHFVELNDLFNPQLGLGARITGQYTNQGLAQTSARSTYDRYTFYRMLSQLGTDTADGRFESGLHPAYGDAYRGRDAVNPSGFFRRAKLNLNYAQDNIEGSALASARVASFRAWQPLNWFTNAANRLLFSEFTNGLPFLPPSRTTNYVPGLPIYGYVRVFDAKNNPYITNYIYDAQAHRLLQLAANIYDTTTNQFTPLPGRQIALPSVFRPIVYEDARTPGVLRLHSYTEVRDKLTDLINTWNVAGHWITPDQATNRLSLSAPQDNQTSFNGRFDVFGLPWVVGAKKGLPNFNEGLWQTIVQPTRRLIITRPTRTSTITQTELPFSGANSAGFKTEVQLILSVTNLAGVEAWNAYNTNFTRPVRIFATNVLDFVLRDETPGAAPAILVTSGTRIFTNFVAATWNAHEYKATLSALVSNNTNINGLNVGGSFIYDPIQRMAFPLYQTNQGRVVIAKSNLRYLSPVVSAYVTNSLLFAVADDATGRLLDIVTLRSVMVRTNLLSTFGLDSRGLTEDFVGIQTGNGSAGTTMPPFWSTNLVQGNRTRGINNQMLASLGQLVVPAQLWLNPQGGEGQVPVVADSTNGLRYFLYGISPTNDAVYAERIRRQYGSNLVQQVGFNPSPKVFLSDRRMANDPLVHYTMDDLAPGFFLLTEAGYFEVPDEGSGLVANTANNQLGTNVIAFDVGRARKYVSAYAPWGTNFNFTGAPPNVGNAVPVGAGVNGAAVDYAYKDPLIRSADDWNFPIGTNLQFRFGGIGDLGRIHRGTPWQTIYLKSQPAFELAKPSRFTRFAPGNLTWTAWAGNRRTQPTNDWKYLDLFTTANNDSAARGQLGVNTTNLAAWSAVLSAVPLLQNNNPANRDELQPLFLQPGSPELQQMLAGGYAKVADGTGTNSISGIQTLFVGQDKKEGLLPFSTGPLPNLGSILQVPTLSDRAPFLHTDVNWLAVRNLSDEVLERVPQQILSLLRADEPRFVIYSFGQTLKPAPSAISLRPGPLYGIATNYAITGEYVTKTVLRLDGDPRRLQPVIEDQRVILSNP